MNDEILLNIYNKYGLKKVGSFDQFKIALQTTEGQSQIHSKYLTSVGTFEQFQKAIGFSQVEQPQQEIVPVAPEVKTDGSSFDPIDFAKKQAFGATSPVAGALAQVPYLGDFLVDASSQVASVATDLIPQTIATSRLKGASARAKEFENMAKFWESQGRDDKSKAFFAEAEKLRGALPELEKEIASQKQDSQDKLTGNIQNLEDIKDAKSFVKWLGNSIGQAAGQIPLSVATLGYSSFMMEAAAVYDEQLDLLSEKHNMSREEIINNGLDKPAEGDVYALLAGALDAVSAGRILKIFKQAGTKELKKGSLGKIKDFLKNAGGEAITEGTQGQLETFGATRGSETEFNVDWNKFLNEAAAGAVGGGGLGLMIPSGEGSSKVDRIKRDQDIDESTQLDDKELQSKLDEAINPAKQLIEKALDGIELSKNTKAQDIIAAAENAVIAAKQEQNRAEQEARIALRKEDQVRFAAEKLREFDSMPHIGQENSQVAPEAIVPQTAEAVVGETSIQPEIVSEQQTAPIIDATETVISAPVKKQSKATAKPVISEPIVTIEKVKVGYEKDLESFSKEALLDEIESLREDDSERSKSQLVLAETEAKARKINLNVIDKRKKNQEAKFVEQQEKQLEKHASKVVKLKDSTKKIFKRKRTESIERLEGVVEQATKLYEETQYEPYLEFAKEAAGFQDKLIKEIADRKTQAEESKGLAVERKKKVKTKEERQTERDEKRAAREKKDAESNKNKTVKVKSYPKLGTDFIQEREGKLGEVREQFYDEIARAEELGLGNKAVNDAIEAYIDFRKSNNLSMEVNGKPLTAEDIKKRAFTKRGSVAKKIAEKKKAEDKDIIEAEKMGVSVRDYQALKSDLKAAEARGISLSEYQALPKPIKTIDKSEVEEVRKALADELGIDPSEIDGLDDGFTEFKSTERPTLTVKFTEYLAETVREMTKKGFSRERLYKISPEDLIRRLRELPVDFRSKYSVDIINQLSKLYKNKKKHLDIVLYDLPSNSSGVFISSKNRDILMLFTGVFDKTNTSDKTHGTILHELMHGKTNALAMMVYELVPSFAKKINSLYDRSKVVLDKAFEEFIEGKIKEDDLFNYDFTKLDKKSILYRYIRYVKEFHGEAPFRNFISKLSLDMTSLVNDRDAHGEKSEQAKLGLILAKKRMFDFAYGFTNQAEFISEGTSSIKFAALLHSIPTYGKIEQGRTFKTVLQDMFKELRAAFNHLVGDKTYQTAFDELEFLMNTYDDIFDEGSMGDKPDPKFYSKTFGDLFIENIKGNKALDAYEESIEKVKRAENFFINEKKSTSKDTESKAYKIIVKGVSGLLELSDSIKSEKDVQDFLDKVNRKLDTSKQLGGTYVRDIWRQIKRDRKSLSNDLKARDFYVGKLKSAPEYSDVTSKYYHDVNDFVAVDMNTENRRNRGILLSEGFSQLVNNSIISKRAYDIVLNVRVADVLSTLEKNKDKLNTSWLTKQAVKGSNPMTAITAMSKYNKEVSDSLMKKMYENLMWAYSQSGVKSDRFWKSLSDYAEKHNFNHTNLARIGMYGAIFSTEADPQNTELWEKEVLRNAEVAVINAKNKITAKEEGTYSGDLSKESINKELEIALDLFSKVEKNTSMDGVLSKDEIELYNMIRSFASDNEMEFFRNAKAVWNQEPPKRHNYFPTQAQGRTDMTGLKSYADDELIRSNADNIFDALSDSDKARYNALFGKKVGSVYRRLSPKKGYYYEFDALAIGKRWSKNLLFDTYASSELKVANRVLNSQTSKKVFGIPMRDALIKQIKISAGAGLRYDHNVSRFWKAVMKVRDYSYMSTMLTTGQLVLQTSSGLAAATIIAGNINPLKAGKTFGKAVQAASGAFNKESKFYKLLEERGLGIQLRDAGFEKYLSPEDYRGNIRAGQIRKFSERASEFAITSADKFAARLVWFSAYFDAGGTLDKVSEDAVRKAERTTGLLQGISDVRWTPENFAYDSLTKKLIFGSLYAYKRFSLNAWLSLVSSMRNINEPEARTIAAAQFGSYLAYHAATLYVTRPFWNWAIEQVENIFGYDDDDEEKEEKRTAKWEELLYNVGWDATVGSPMPAFVDQALRYFAVNFGPAQKMWKDPYEDYDQYLDSPLYAPKSIDEAYKALIGPGLKEPVSMGFDGLETLLLYSQADSYEDTQEDIDKRDFTTDQWMFNTVADIIGAAPYVPLRGDIRKILKGINDKRKQDYFREKRDSKSGTNVDGSSVPDSQDLQYENFVGDTDSYSTNENP